jgi:hypothetical protein
MLLSTCTIAQVRAGDSFCTQSQTAQMPTRSATAPTGSELAARLGGIDDDAREEIIRSELLAGNIPQFLRRLQPVELSSDLDGQSTRIIVCVMPDYLALGSDRDYLLVPMRLQTALAVADRYGFTLPTTALVDAIYAQAAVHLAPRPLPASPAMRSTAYYLKSNAMVRSQRTQLDAAPGMLISGDKKDLVLTNRLWNNPERVAIYGWHTLDGHPIQPLSTLHGWHYVDYSHGVRLVSTRILINDKPESLLAALQNTLTARLLSYEGAISGAPDLIARLAQAHVQHISALVR